MTRIAWSGEETMVDNMTKPSMIRLRFFTKEETVHGRMRREKRIYPGRRGNNIETDGRRVKREWKTDGKQIASSYKPIASIPKKRLAKLIKTVTPVTEETTPGTVTATAPLLALAEAVDFAEVAAEEG